MTDDLRAASSVLVREKESNKYLLEYSNDRQAWQLPGGRLRTNESPYDALTRELNEEISLDKSKTENLKLMAVDFRFDKFKGDSMMHFFFTMDYIGDLKKDLHPDNVEVNNFDLFDQQEAISRLKDRYAAKRIQYILNSPEASCMYFENAEPVF